MESFRNLFGTVSGSSLELLQKLFKEQPGAEPERGVIKPYDAFQIEFRAAVVPRAEMAFFQKEPGGKFAKEDQRGVDTAPEQRIFSF